MGVMRDVVQVMGTDAGTKKLFLAKRPPKAKKRQRPSLRRGTWPCRSDARCRLGHGEQCGNLNPFNARRPPKAKSKGIGLRKRRGVPGSRRYPYGAKYSVYFHSNQVLKTKDTTNNPPIIIRMVNRKSKINISKNGRKLKGTNVYVSEQLSRNNADISAFAQLKCRQSMHSTAIQFTHSIHIKDLMQSGANW